MQVKELSIEEKARRYDEAIEKFDVILNLNTVKESGTICTDDVRKILPELAESEDEKIRKAIIEIVKKDEERIGTNAHLKKIQWLEKKGEKGTNGNEREIPYFVWSKEDEKIYSRIYDLIHNAAYANYDVDEDGKELGEYAKIAEWFKSIKDRVQPQSKQEWSKEDERKIDRIYFILRQAADTHAFSTSCRLIGDKECIELQDFLKYLKGRVGCEANCTTMWKPSGEQMKFLWKYAEQNNYDGSILTSLYNDLKKLKG